MPTATSATRTRVTISVPTDIAQYLRSTRNASALVCEAIPGVPGARSGAPSR